ncbi:PREDICTED: uncharacterized protein LOC106302659 [Brassica oleracea var. oleracea]|uniref:uncharacterized protein LOC106302659 n=1 Tax=Brassica oleracea var. oleracea TaxID=109376 RepID=UPI0006A7272D|nr:PREDICTED: uncharacterized protein LOC106302659 [Brassica oleracea var. oleracea]
MAVDPTCVHCNEADETCSHLFFNCNYSKQIWQALVGGILKGAFTTDWNDIVTMVSSDRLPSTKQFLLQYTFQATVHAVWRERNGRRHGEQAKSASLLAKLVDKTIRLKLLMVDVDWPMNYMNQRFFHPDFLPHQLAP